jgi:hypothetical protein
VSFVHGLELLVAHALPAVLNRVILETGPAVSIRSELLVAHEKLVQLPLLTV